MCIAVPFDKYVIGERRSSLLGFLPGPNFIEAGRENARSEIVSLLLGSLTEAIMKRRFTPHSHKSQRLAGAGSLLTSSGNAESISTRGALHSLTAST